MPFKALYNEETLDILILYVKIDYYTLWFLCKSNLKFISTVSFLIPSLLGFKFDTI